MNLWAYYENLENKTIDVCSFVWEYLIIANGLPLSMSGGALAVDDINAAMLNFPFHLIRKSGFLLKTIFRQPNLM